MPLHFLDVSSLSDVGRLRTDNEDSLATDIEHGIVVLADGMGGHRAGGIASRIATETVVAGLKASVAQFGSGADGAPRQAIEQAIDQANKTIFQTAKGRSTYQGMGTTVAVALFHDNRVTLGHVGDSRIYRLRGGRLALLTRDDSLLRDQVEVGMISAADAGESHNRHLLTQALGMQENVSAHLREEEAIPGDIFLLCSDGLSDLVDDADIELIVGSLKMNLPLVAHHLIQVANDSGGYDNVSVILVIVREPFPAPDRRGWASRIFGWMR